MIGVGISAGLSGSKRARSIQDPLPALDLDWATDRSLPAAYGPTPSFSRASTATYFTSSGVLTSAAINGPRFNHVYNGSSWVSKGLLIEEQRTNVYLHSQSFNNAAYTKEDCTVSADAGVAPDGTTTSDKIIPNTNNTDHAIYNTVANGSYTISVFAKAAGYNYLFIGKNNSFASDGAFFDLVNGTVSQNTSGGTTSIINCGNGWFRCIHTPTTATQYPLFCTSANGTSFTHAGDGTSGILLWGSQAEVGSFATSYIPTTTAAVTRSADVCQITGGDFSGFWNASEGSIAIEYDMATTALGSAIQRPLTVWNSGYTSGIVLDNRSAGTTIELGTNAAVDFGSVVSPSSIAMAYKINDFAASRNGAAVLTDTSGTVVSSPILMNIGNNVSSLFHNGHISRLRYYNTRLTNSQLQGLTL
jgi:hypothetical protein